jgi:hypothetical protein
VRASRLAGGGRRWRFSLVHAFPVGGGREDVCLPFLVRVGACDDELRLMGGGRGSTLVGVAIRDIDSSSLARNKSSACAPLPAIERMWLGPYGARAYCTVQRVVSGGLRKARLCALARRFIDTKG